MARIHDLLQQEGNDDPRFGMLALLARTLDERRSLYDRLVRWWDQQEAQGMREAFYRAITTEPQEQEPA